MLFTKSRIICGIFSETENTARFLIFINKNDVLHKGPFKFEVGTNKDSDDTIKPMEFLKESNPDGLDFKLK